MCASPLHPPRYRLSASAPARTNFSRRWTANPSVIDFPSTAVPQASRVAGASSLRLWLIAERNPRLPADLPNPADDQGRAAWVTQPNAGWLKKFLINRLRLAPATPMQSAGYQSNLPVSGRGREGRQSAHPCPSSSSLRMTAFHPERTRACGCVALGTSPDCPPGCRRCFGADPGRPRYPRGGVTGSWSVR